MQINFCLYFIPICVIIECVASSLQEPNLHRFPDYKHIGRYRRQAECGNGEFKCNSGQCIDEKLLCDGKADCVDGSDEKNCDGRITPTTKATPTKPTGSPPPGGCLIPKHPVNGQYSIALSTDLKPGDYAPMFSAILITCKNNYKVSPTLKEMYPLCVNGQWSQPPPSCERACPPIVSTPTTIIKCKYRGIPLQNCDNPVEDTIANLACQPLYEVPGISNNSSRICKDGSWNYPIPQCVPICGQKRPQGVANVVGGQIAKENDYPWHVGVYKIDNDYLCGGSIISLKVVLSAAHCFTESNGNRIPPENFKIAGGKYHRIFDDERDKNAQTSLVDAIHIPERFRGILTNYEADIAVVVLQTPFKITTSVQPICLDRTNEFEYLQLAENNVGVVVGWGYVDYDQNLSDELKEIHVPFKSYAECYEKVNKKFRKYLTHDKLCARYLLENKSVCQGDSGGGLAFEWNQNRYYIRGIVGTSPSSAPTGVPTCDAENYGTYTQISKYIEFVTETEILNRV